MAVTTTPRLGLKTYSSGADPHPTRSEFNAQQTTLESMVALAAQGTLAARPTAGKWGRMYYATDNGRVYWDTGTTWVEVTNVGGGGAGAALAIGGAGAEGSSARAARADHTHPLPLATASVDGAMSSADKSKLDGAKVSATAGALVVRDAAGRAQFSSPLADGDAANKSYVDQQMSAAASASHTHPWSEITGVPATYAPSAHDHAAADITSGVLAAARLPLATTSVAGAMSSADKTKLDQATSSATASRLVVRDASGRIQVGTPAAAGDASTKGYVDQQVATAAPASHTHAWGDLTGVPATMPPSAHTHLWADITDAPTGLTNAETSAVGGSVVKRTPDGTFSAGEPTAGAHVATKSYVDNLSTIKDASTGDYWRVTSQYVGYWGGSGWKVAFDRVKGEMYIGSVPWGSVTGRPSSFNPSSHNHSAGDITSGVVRYGSIRGTEGVHDYAVSGSVPGTSYAVWVDGQGKFGRNTSSIRYKARVEDWAGDSSGILALEPRTYVRRDEDGNEPGPDAPRELGLIAEEVDRYLPEVVIRDAEGRVDGLRYDLLPVAMLPLIQELVRRVQVLEAR